MNLLRFVTGDAANIYATFIQAVGLWMFGLLLVVLARSVDRDWFEDFAKGFVFLAAAITSLRIAFGLGSEFGQAFLFGYFLGEYLFLYFLVRGVRRLAGLTASLRGAPLGFLLFASILTAAGLSSISDFSSAFVVQAAIMAAGLFAAFAYARKDPAHAAPGFGLHLLRLALFVLGVGFAQYVPVLIAVLWGGRDLPGIYSSFLPVFDLLFEAALAFAMIVTGMESVQNRLQSTNASLEQARARLDLLARTDPLTELMNRHAFASIFEESSRMGIAGGSLAVIDLNGLKAINDGLGHQAGDQAIRAFARALRAKLRADDLIFRWGGDEFLAVLFGLPAEDAAARLSEVGQVVFRTGETGLPMTVGGSFGVAAFESVAELRAACEAADAAMYQAKRSARHPVDQVIEKTR